MTLDSSDNRQQVTRRAKAYLPDPDADVQPGDRIRRDNDGTSWRVVEVKPGDTSPFTGWRPGQVLTVEHVTGG
ncbi:MAG: hypothetical protein LBK54_10325 [Propionibacteriaceae bacterium]|jgi:hypothetical protein|nr:hypothetical protein [Propionibacteriaceae bacterium]